MRRKIKQKRRFDSFLTTFISFVFCKDKKTAKPHSLSHKKLTKPRPFLFHHHGHERYATERALTSFQAFSRSRRAPRRKERNAIFFFCAVSSPRRRLFLTFHPPPKIQTELSLPKGFPLGADVSREYGHITKVIVGDAKATVLTPASKEHGLPEQVSFFFFFSFFLSFFHCFSFFFFLYFLLLLTHPKNHNKKMKQVVTQLNALIEGDAAATLTFDSCAWWMQATGMEGTAQFFKLLAGSARASGCQTADFLIKRGALPQIGSGSGSIPVRLFCFCFLFFIVFEEKEKRKKSHTDFEKKQTKKRSSARQCSRRRRVPTSRTRRRSRSRWRRRSSRPTTRSKRTPRGTLT